MYLPKKLLFCYSCGLIVSVFVGFGKYFCLKCGHEIHDEPAKIQVEGHMSREIVVVGAASLPSVGQKPLVYNPSLGSHTNT